MFCFLRLRIFTKIYYRVYFTILLARRIKILFQKIQNLISKIEYPFMVKKIPSLLRININFFNLVKVVQEKYTANITYTGKRLNGFSLRPATWQDHPFLPLQLNTVLETYWCKVRKINKNFTSWKRITVIFICRPQQH